MKTLRLSLTGSDGTPCEVPYTLPQSVRFDCFVPEAGICVGHVDISADEVVVDELLQPGLNGAWYNLSLTELDDRLTRDVLEQAGDVCAVFERILSTECNPIMVCSAEDAKTLTTIADIANQESDLHLSWWKLAPEVAQRDKAPQDPHNENDSYAFHALHRFIHTVLVERAQDVATKAARARQQAWEAQQACVPCGGSGEGSTPEGVCGRCQPGVRL